MKPLQKYIFFLAFFLTLKVSAQQTELSALPGGLIQLDVDSFRAYLLRDVHTPTTYCAVFYPPCNQAISLNSGATSLMLENGVLKAENRCLFLYGADSIIFNSYLLGINQLLSAKCRVFISHPLRPTAVSLLPNCQLELIDWENEAPAQDYSVSIHNTSDRASFRVIYQLDGFKQKIQAELLCALLSQDSSSFQKNLVASGLCIRAKTFVKGDCEYQLVFEIDANPFGLKDALSQFFKELDLMPYFNYSTVAQLALAKKRYFFRRDSLFSMFSDLTADYAPLVLQEELFLQDSVRAFINAYNKRDLLNFIQQHIDYAAKTVIISGTLNDLEEAAFYFPETKEPAAYSLQFHPRQKRINAAQSADLRDLTFFLNLSPPKPIVIRSYAKRRRWAKKRAQDLSAYFQRNGLGNRVEIRAIRNNKNYQDEIRLDFNP